MENASKALIIAGAILLVIAIIAIAVGVVNKTKGTIATAGNEIDAMTIKVHNDQFAIYDGIIKGTDVKKCIAKVLANNSKTSDNNMKIWVELTATNSANNKLTTRYGVNGTTTYNTSLVTTALENNRDFKCTTYINTQGIINKIVIVEQ